MATNIETVSGVIIKGAVHLLIPSEGRDCVQCSLNEKCFELRNGSICSTVAEYDGFFKEAGQMIEVICPNPRLN